MRVCDDLSAQGIGHGDEGPVDPRIIDVEMGDRTHAALAHRPDAHPFLEKPGGDRSG
jgi:hypothetical protein